MRKLTEILGLPELNETNSVPLLLPCGCIARKGKGIISCTHEKGCVCQAAKKSSISEENMHRYKRGFIDVVERLSRENASHLMVELYGLLKPFAKKDPKLRKLLDEVSETILKEMRLL